MALNIPGTQIYAGRYHHGNIKTLDLFQEAGKTEPSKTRYLKDEVLKDTVTFSDEGLAKSKNWREYLKDDPVMVSSFHYQKQREELNKQLHTVNIIDSVSMFQCELGEVASGIEAEYKKGEHFSSKEEFLDVMEKSYQIIYSRIEEDFADPNREKTWLLQKDGSYVEETKQDRIKALDQAYRLRLSFAESGRKSIEEIKRNFYK